MYLSGPIEQTVRQANYDEDTLARLADYYQHLVQTGRAQAAGFLMARDGKVFAHQTTGRLSHRADRADAPLRPDSIRRIASVTKVITAAAVMKLVEQGVLWLEQPVATLIPEFDTPLHREIHLRHLLTHTSGLPADGGYFGEPYPRNLFDSLFAEGWLTKTVLAGPLLAPPGTTWAYSTIGFSVLGEVVARASGRPFAEYAETEIFKALGMNRSFFVVPPELHDQVATNQDWELEVVRDPIAPRGSPPSGGGGYSTLADLNLFAQAFLGGGQVNGRRILSPKTVAEMTRNQLDGVSAFHWGKRLKNYRQGLGWGFFCDGSTVGPAVFNHEGWGWSSVFADPEERFVFVSTVVDSRDWDPVVMVNPRTIAFSGLR